jgi:hypothetical protein
MKINLGEKEKFWVGGEGWLAYLIQLSPNSFS